MRNAYYNKSGTPIVLELDEIIGAKVVSNTLMVKYRNVPGWENLDVPEANFSDFINRLRGVEELKA